MIERLCCHICGTEWERERRGGSRPKYCSPNCKQKADNKARREKTRTRTCCMCGAEFKPKGPQKRCSKRCNLDYKAKTTREKRADPEVRESYLAYMKSYNEKYRAQNADRLKEKKREYYRRNREKIRDYQKTWREENETELKRRKKIYYYANQDKKLEHDRQWRRDNAEELRRRDRERYRNDPVHRERIRSRRALRMGAKVEEIDDQVLLEKNGYKCGICGGVIPQDVDRYHPLYLHIDHIVPLSKGGEHSYANTQPAHASCNLQKGDKLDGWQGIRPILPEGEGAA